ncbi:MAG: phage major capsid protein [Clostridia bacterium]|nr:phage major capsid protein [Clostridia bacterium]
MKMNKAMRDLLTAIEQKNTAARAETDTEKKAALVKEAKALTAQYETEKAIFESEELVKGANEEPVKAKVADGGAKTDDARKSFFQAAREGFPKNKTLSINNEGTAADGGYTVPEDIVTKVERLRDAHAHLLSLIRVEKVNTNSGARTFLSRAAHSAFTAVNEGGKIGKKTGPAFQRLTYTIQKLAGYIAATNELLADSDEAIENFLVEWLGEAAAKTDDTKILAAVATNTATALDGLDGIKSAINVTLGSTFAGTSSIITNDDGLNYLDTLKDGDDRYLLSPDPANAMQMRLAVGARFIPIVVVPNADLPSAEVKTEVEGVETVAGYKYPFIIGDLKEGIIKFDRQTLAVKASDVAIVGSGDDQLNAYEEDLTLLRGIMRADYKVRDAAAFVNGYIQVSAS